MDEKSENEVIILRLSPTARLAAQLRMEEAHAVYQRYKLLIHLGFSPQVAVKGAVNER